MLRPVAQIVANKLVWNMPIDQAVSFPRLHHGWFPDELRFEKADDPAWANVVADLRLHGVLRCALKDLF